MRVRCREVVIVSCRWDFWWYFVNAKGSALSLLEARQQRQRLIQAITATRIESPMHIAGQSPLGAYYIYTSCIPVSSPTRLKHHFLSFSYYIVLVYLDSSNARPSSFPLVIDRPTRLDCRGAAFRGPQLADVRLRFSLNPPGPSAGVLPLRRHCSWTGYISYRSALA